MCQKTWKDKIITKIYLFSELCSLCCEFLEPRTFIWMWTNEENVVVKDRNKNAQRFLLKNKNVKKRVFYFKIENVKNVFNIYGI